MTNSARYLGILLFDGMEELDAIGPWEVFAWWTQHFPGDGYLATTFSADGGPVTCEKSLVVQPHHSIDSVPALDVLLHPGGDGTIPMLTDPAHLKWLREQRTHVPLITSVCTGATVLAAAGLLHGRPATTNRKAFDRLRELDATITPRPGERYVDDGDIITSAGISAGIDMALHIVARLAGPTRAHDVREGIEYSPDPPH
ncbi:DJ-1/PfpI family protein [Nocardia altamirensis]|uniref:DJ-1/PfpI family protein n=1 Tax=Nocardia altamirensis TaxID=472158 RepID=UPI000840384A|nr:DJ-1/PfpI family protein [Nocardia altamirensis]